MKKREPVNPLPSHKFYKLIGYNILCYASTSNRMGKNIGNHVKMALEYILGLQEVGSDQHWLNLLVKNVSRINN